MGPTVKIHVQAAFKYGPLEQLVGVLDVQASVRSANGQERAQLFGLAMIDQADGEAHVYVFTEEGKQALLRTLTGGIVVPGLEG